MASSFETMKDILADLRAEDMRAFLLEHPEFLEANKDLLDAELPVEAGVEDFQRYRMARLQQDYLNLRSEHDDLMDLMQDHLQRQARMNAAICALLDSGDFQTTLHIVGRELASILELEAVGFFMETGGWLEKGEYEGLKVVAPGYIGRWLSGRNIVFEEIEGEASKDLYGDVAKKVRSQALLKLTVREGMPPGLLAFGHHDPVHFATGIATEQIECLGSVIERCLRKWLV